MKLVLLFLLTSSALSFCNPSKNEPMISASVSDTAETPLPLNDSEVVDTLLSISDTILQTKKYRLTFRKVDSILIPALYADEQARLEILNKHDNSFDAAKATEQYLSQTQGEYFRRSGPTLTLNLKNGKTATLKDNDDEEESEFYNYENYFAALDAYLVRVQWYEGNGYLLVSRSTGQKSQVIGQVYPSPSGNELISVSEDLEAGFSTNGFQLLSKTGEGFVMRFTIVAGNWAPLAIKWQDDKNLIVKVKKSVDDNLINFETQYYKLTIDRNGR